MLPKTRQVLDELDAVLAMGDDVSAEVADVLSALRGPDFAAPEGLKWNTTAVIRAAAFPRTASSADAAFRAGWDMHVNAPIVLARRRVFDIAHFRYHVQRAATTLGLTVRYEPEE